MTRRFELRLFLLLCALIYPFMGHNQKAILILLELMNQMGDVAIKSGKGCVDDRGHD